MLRDGYGLIYLLSRGSESDSCAGSPSMGVQRLHLKP